MSTISQNNEFPLWDIMNIGSNLEFLCRVTSRMLIKSPRPDRIGIADRLRMLQKDLESLELSQSERILMTEVKELLRSIEDDNRHNYLGDDAIRLRRIAKRVKESLNEEGNQRRAFVALRDREGQIASLLSDPVQFFGIPPGDILELTPIGLEDFYEAAKCYSVGFSAASIMFMLRATEEVLRSYYSKVTQQDARNKNWGSLLTDLRMPVLRCPPELMNLLEELLRKRNAAMHPRRREPNEWDVNAAREVLEKCRHAIQMMVCDLERRSGAVPEGAK